MVQHARAAVEGNTAAMNKHIVQGETGIRLGGQGRPARLAEFLDARLRGEAPTAEELLARYPEHAVELGDYLEGVEELGEGILVVETWERWARL